MRCPLWVTSGHHEPFIQCQLYPPESCRDCCRAARRLRAKSGHRIQFERGALRRHFPERLQVAGRFTNIGRGASALPLNSRTCHTGEGHQPPLDNRVCDRRDVVCDRSRSPCVVYRQIGA
jgi:hypothetical protein